MDTADRSGSVVGQLVEAFAWGSVGALATATVGFAGHLIGSRLYPQRYEQIPSDFFFVPLGLLLGFMAAGMARLAAPRRSAFAMMSFVSLASVAYGGAMFEYSRVDAVPERLSAVIEPEPTDAVVCTSADCETTTPALQWYVTGRLRVSEESGLGATVDRIEISSDTYSTGRPVVARPSTREAAAEAGRWRGPNVTLTARTLAGPRRLEANAEAIYPIGYAYHTREGSSRRQISITVYATDRAGRPVWTNVTWHVR